MKTRDARKQDRAGRTMADFLPPFAERFRDHIRSRAQPIPQLVRAIVKDHSIEAVHDLRVVSRRLRAALPLARRAVSGRRVKPVARRLKHLTRTLGTARELDVEIHLLQGLREAAEAADERMAAEYLLEQFGARRDREYRRMMRRLKNIKVTKLRRDICELALHIPNSGIVDDPRDAHEALDPLIESAFAGLPALSLAVQPQELHRMRIAIKRLRYASEWLSPAAPSGFKSLIQRLVPLQDCLGSHHDHVQLGRKLSETEQELALRGRISLAAGVQCCRNRISSKHQEQLVHFLELTAKLTASTIHHKARAALGLGEKRPQVGIRLHRVGG